VSISRCANKTVNIPTEDGCVKSARFRI